MNSDTDVSRRETGWGGEQRDEFVVTENSDDHVDLGGV